MKLRLISATILTTAILGAMSAPSGASSTPFDQMKAVVANVKAEHSVHYAETLTTTGKRLVNTTDATRVGGRQTIVLTESGKSNSVIIELIAGGLYVKGDSAILISYMGFPKTTANQLSNKWFTIPKNNPDYAEVGQGLTLSSVAAELSMNRSVTTRPSVRIAGVKVDVLKGTSVKTALDPSVPETLYVTTTSTPLPLQVVQSFGGTAGAVVFSHWGETVKLVVPPATLQLK